VTGRFVPGRLVPDRLVPGRFVTGRFVLGRDGLNEHLPDRARQAAKKVIWNRKRKRMQVPATNYVFLFLINKIIIIDN
jgi:hypothetical protein